MAHICPGAGRERSLGRGHEKGLRDPSFEVVVEAAEALGEIGGDQRVWQVLLELRESLYWQVRNRGPDRDPATGGTAVVSPRGHAGGVSSFILDGDDFRPHFSIKQTYQTVQKRCRENLAGETGDQELASSHPDHRERTT